MSSVVAASKRPLAFQRALLLSFLLHTSLLLAWAGGGIFSPGSPQEGVLVMDLFGMVSDRQVEERHMGEEIPPEPEIIPEPEPEPEPEKISESSVPLAREKPAPRPPKPIARPRQAGAQEEQLRRTVSQKEMEASLMRQYLAELSRAVRGRLRYPVEAKARGYTGAVRVSFVITADGQVQPGSETVRTGSGHPMLDDAALNAVRDSRDLPKPPRRMEVVVSVNFREEK